MIWIVDGDSEEALTRDTPGTLRSWVSLELLMDSLLVVNS